MSRLLVVSPGFHGYYRSVAVAFEQLGYHVETYCYDLARSRPEKAWNKLRHELPAVLRGELTHLSVATATRRAAEHVRDIRPDLVLVIRGDVLTEEFWQAATEGGRRCVVWLYDELRRTTFDADLVSRYAGLATYSSLDAESLSARGVPTAHVPLGFDHFRTAVAADDCPGLVSFIGAPLAARREALLALTGAGIPVQAWGRGWSSHVVDRARTWRWRTSGVPNGRDVPGEAALGIMRDSVATLNIHGDQDGFTMRTFEACGVGAVQLVDRSDVDAFYEPGAELLVFQSHEDLIEQARHVMASRGRLQRLRERARARTLAEHTLVHRARLLGQLWA